MLITINKETFMTLTHSITAASLMLIGLAGSFAAHAQESKEALYTKSLAATCANCHGTNGNVVSGSPVVGLAGLPADYIAAQMKAFKSGALATRKSTKWLRTLRLRKNNEKWDTHHE
jgi:cytochrome c553